ncbi:sigma-70 family RNA polymerase sigma factor [Chryseobacterium oranimense]|uniref:RNA polymerase sigma factor n=1 Tax=Chryseobacterium oranimense TaxID=421058 RepID=UPI0021B00B8C|nr:sigma-70 family RNA polymerase sigma factor [Chryseobacterium oranimense]UWX61215.1 sigma-70 family RNA polymerase sigma factor [Chryseobacterium oranimense]
MISKNNLDESQLILRLANGDLQAFNTIFDLYHSKMYWFVLNLVKKEANTEDIVQNVFIHLWKYRVSIDHKYSLDTILYKISKQEVVNWYRKYSKEFIFDEEIDLIDEDHSKNEDLENKLIQMQHLLEKLPNRRKAILQMNKMQGKSYKEIADELDMTTSSVANQVAKGMQFLKKYMLFFFM